jgi:hypothetical protein
VREVRPYFYTAGTLVKEGIIQLSERWGDLMGVKVELDRRMLDFIVGLDTEFSELVEGSHRCVTVPPSDDVSHI